MTRKSVSPEKQLRRLERRENRKQLAAIQVTPKRKTIASLIPGYIYMALDMPKDQPR